VYEYIIVGTSSFNCDTIGEQMIWQDVSHVENVRQQIELHDQHESTNDGKMCDKGLDTLTHHEEGRENCTAFVTITGQNGLVHACENESMLTGDSLHSHHVDNGSPAKDNDWLEEVEVTYRVDESPPFGFCVLLGFQVQF
jgi:hypothetical protein